MNLLVAPSGAFKASGNGDLSRVLVLKGIKRMLGIHISKSIGLARCDPEKVMSLPPREKGHIWRRTTDIHLSSKGTQSPSGDKELCAQQMTMWSEHDILQALSETLVIAYSDYTDLLFIDHPPANIHQLIEHERKVIRDIEDLILDMRVKNAVVKIK